MLDFHGLEVLGKLHLLASTTFFFGLFYVQSSVDNELVDFRALSQYVPLYLADVSLDRRVELKQLVGVLVIYKVSDSEELVISV